MNKPLSSDDIAANRDRIIAAAARLFAEEGAGAITMRRLAAELGMSRTTPYTYFKDKAEIIDGIRIDALDRLTAIYRAIFAAEPHPLKRLAAMGEAYLAFALAEPNAYRVLFDLKDGLEHDNPEVAAAVARLTEASHEPLRACVEAGWLRGPVEEVNLATWSAMHGLVSLHLSGRLPPGHTAQSLLPLIREILGAGLTLKEAPSCQTT
jgi:AcrR family transcriptional regulator